jgi:hypothetical protein
MRSVRWQFLGNCPIFYVQRARYTGPEKPLPDRTYIKNTFWLKNATSLELYPIKNNALKN